MNFSKGILAASFVVIFCMTSISGPIKLPDTLDTKALFHNLPRPEEMKLVSEKDVPLQLWVAEQYLKRGKFKEVIRISRQINNRFPRNIRAHAHLAAAYKVTGSDKEFKKESEEIKKLAPESPLLFLSLATAYLSLKDNIKAEETFKKGINLSSDNTELRMSLALLYNQTGRPKKAREEYLLILNTKDLAMDNFLNASYALCNIYQQEGKFEKAVKIANNTINLYPPIPKGYQLLSSICLKKGDTNQAIKTYEKLMKANAQVPVPYQELALIYADVVKNYKKGLNYAVEGVKRFPKDAKSQDVLGWMYYNKGKYPDALKYFKEAVSLDKHSSYFLYHLGLAYQKLGNKDQAIEVFEQALNSLDPHIAKKFYQEISKQLKQCK